MARKKPNKEVEAEQVEIVEELPVEELLVEEALPLEEEEQEVAEAVEPLDVPPLQQPVKPPKYYHVDQFLQTAIPLYGLNSMQARGFTARMQGRQYQTDMLVFVDELKKYLNIQ
jgi:hypothetical protein